MKNKIDKPLGKIEDDMHRKIELIDEILCGVCNSQDCYDIIAGEKGITKMTYYRGTIFLCKKCYKDTLFFDNLIWKIIKPFLKLKRKFRI